MSDEENGNELAEIKWHVDLDWLDKNGRSLPAMTQHSICSKCRKKLKMDKGEVSADKLIDAIQSCCSKEKDFMNGGMPLMERIFRTLLAGGNRPVTLAELSEQLHAGLGGPIASPEMLFRLLAKDRFYGFNRA